MQRAMVQGGHPSPPLASGPAGRARAVLLDSWPQPDAIVAKLADASPAMTGRARAELEALGVIPHRGGDSGLSDDAYRELPPGERARAELLADPARSNLIIADLADCHAETVLKARRQLEASGAIPEVGRWDRRRRPGSGRGGLREQRTGLSDSELNRYAALPPQPPSMAAGLCVTGRYDPDLWHPSQGGDDHGQRAVAICRRCPALDDCAAWSLSLTVKDHAVYGGMTAAVRQQRRAQRRSQLPLP